MAWQTTWGRTTKGKYGNSTVTTKDAIWDSKKEYRYSQTLELLKRGGAITEWLAKPEYTLKGLNGGVICKIVPDFLVTLPDGGYEIHEVKCSATKTSVWRLKRKLWVDNFPHIPYKVIE